MDNFVFISYSSQDKNVADAVCHYLEENNIACWIAPRDILPGQSWAGAIIKAIRNCSTMVLIYSKNSNSSAQVANEIDKAFSNNKTIIPFMTDATPLNDDYEYYLSRKHWLLAYPDFKPMFPALLKAVSAIVPSTIYSVTDNNEHTEKPKVPKLSEQHVVAKPKLSSMSSVEVNNDEASVNSRKNEFDVSVDTDPITTISIFRPKWASDISEIHHKVILDIIKNMVMVKGGILKLGATEEQLNWARQDEKPAHVVELSTYWINKYAVTQFEWESIMGYNPSKYKGEKLPVEQVSLHDCRNFVKKLISLSGINFSLPTEAQWEYAARGGIKSKGYIYSGSNDLQEVGWKLFDSGNTHEVGLKKPNELGLYDMSGNVSEWCDEEKGKYTSDFIKDPHNNYKTSFWSSQNFIHRGGDFLSSKKCRVSYRESSPLVYKSDTIGLRLVINGLQ